MKNNWDSVSELWLSLDGADKQTLDLYFSDRLAATDLTPKAAALVKVLFYREGQAVIAEMLEALEGVVSFIERLAGDKPYEAANPELWRKLERAQVAIASAKGSDA